MRGLNLSKFKKANEDKHFATLVHADGHTLIIAKGPLGALHRKQLEKLETVQQKKIQHMDEGGTLQPDFVTAQRDPQLNQAQDDLNALQASSGGSSPDDSDDIPRVPVGRDALNGLENVMGTGQQANPADQAVSIDQSKMSNGKLLPDSTDMNFMTGKQVGNFPGGNQRTDDIEPGGLDIQASSKDATTLAPTPKATPPAVPQETLQQRAQTVKNSNAQLSNAFQQKQLDPNQFLSRDTKRFMPSALGVIISSIGQAIGQGRVGNGAIDAINKQLDRDILQEQNDQTARMNTWKMNQDNLHNAAAATLATQTQKWEAIKYRVLEDTAKSNNELTRQRGLQIAGEIDQKNEQRANRLALMGGPTKENQDPALVVDGITEDPGVRKTVKDEINAKKNRVAAAPGVFEAFDNAAQETSSNLRGVIPYTKSPWQRALALRLGPTVSDVEGANRQALLDQIISDVTPVWTDSDQDKDTKRASLEEYMRSKPATSHAESIGLNLNQYPMTNVENIGREGGPGGYKRLVQYDGKDDKNKNAPKKEEPKTERLFLNGKWYVGPKRK